MTATGTPCDRRETVVPAEADGQRLDVFVARWLGASRAEVRRLLGRGGLALDGRTLSVVDKGMPLGAGHRLAVEAYRPPADQVIRPEPDGAAAELVVLAEGPGWLAVDKPAGRPVHPLAPDETGTVLNAVARRHPGIQGVGEGGLRSGVVHRLDVETSGVLLVATREDTWQRLRGAFREHRVLKRYRALVVGRPAPGLVGRHEVALWVARHRPAHVRVAPAHERAERPGAHLGVLAIEAIEARGEDAEVAVRLETGFLHQVRATLAWLGHPVLGDTAYGGGRPGIPRPLLHAAAVRFEEIAAEAPPPADYRAALDRG